MRKIFISLFLIIVGISVAYAATELKQYECPTCTCSGASKTNLAVGDDALVCIHFVQLNSAERVAYPVVVDKYTALQVNSAGYHFMDVATTGNQNISTYIVVQAHGDAKSYPIPFVIRNQTGEYYSNIYSIVLNIEDGNIKEVIWDNVCDDTAHMIQVDFRDFTDDSSRRFDYICNTYATCWGTDFKVRANNEECQLKIYVSWLGTDKNGRRMTSGGLRMSQFRKYSLTDIYEGSANLASSRLLFEDKCFLPN